MAAKEVCFINGAWYHLVPIENYEEKANERLQQLFIELAQAEITRHVDDVSRKSIINAQTALNKLRDFAGGDLRVCDLTPEFFRKFVRSMAGKKPGYVALTLRELRAIVNRLELGEQYSGKVLFKGLDTKGNSRCKRSLTEEQNKQVFNILPGNKKEELALDVYRMQILCNGMPFVDLAHLTDANIHDGWIEYCRKKTGAKVLVKLNPQIEALIAKYHRPGEKYIFPFITMSIEEDGDKLCCYALNRINRILKGVSEKHGLPKITTYTARHTWATLAYAQGTSIEDISLALGHTNTKTTKKYIDAINYNGVYEANNRIMKSIGLPVAA